MALIDCPECGNDVSDKAEACPGCGLPASEIRSSIIENASSPPNTETSFEENEPSDAKEKTSEGSNRENDKSFFNYYFRGQFFNHFINPFGRSGRLAFIIVNIVTISYCAIAGVLWGVNHLTDPLLRQLSLAPAYYWLFVSSIRRLHDKDYSGWWSLGLIIPLTWIIYLAIFILSPGLAKEETRWD